MVALTLSLLNTVAVVVCLRELASVRESRTSRGLPVLTPLPEFVAPRRDGSLFTTEKARGRVLLFLGADCTPCHELADRLRGAQSELPPMVVAVTSRQEVDREDPFFGALDFLPTQDLFVDDERRVFTQLAVPGVPFAYAIDAAGRVRGREAPSSAYDLRKLRPLLG